MLAVVLLACWLANHLFAGRAAFLLVGAMIATAMSANVFFWIIPGQRQVVAAMTSGEPYDAQALSIHGKRGKQRSVHNTYFTLPVIFAMLSNHYSFLYTHEARWVLLFVMMLAGALIRQFFVQRHAFHHGRASNPWPYAAVGVALLLVLIVALKPATPSPSVATAPEQPVTWAQAQAVIGKHCLSCHGPQVQMKGLRFDHSDGVSRNAQNIYQQVVVLQQMPMGNATGMTAEERALLGRWFKAGAPTQ